MKRSLALVIASVAIIGAHRASAQDIAPGPGTLEVTVTPGGATFFTSKNGAPKFGDYTLGGATTYNINRVVGIEGEVGGSVKWYAPNGRWGVRGDYRFIALGGKDTGAAFLGQDDRYGHRVYGGIIINAIR